MFDTAFEGRRTPVVGLGRSTSVMMFEPPAPDQMAQRLLQLVALARGVQPSQLVHRARCRSRVAVARQLAMYLMHVALGWQYAEVGQFFGRDRTTVSHACAVIEDMREAPGFDAEVEQLETLIEALATMPGQRHG